LRGLRHDDIVEGGHGPSRGEALCHVRDYGARQLSPTVK